MTGCDIGDNNYAVLAGVCVCVCVCVLVCVYKCVTVCACMCIYTWGQPISEDLHDCKQTLHSNRGHLRGGQRTLIFHSF